MKLRVIKQKSAIRMLCMNGSIINVTDDILRRLLTEFQNPSAFKGKDGYWSAVSPDMEQLNGTTLAYVDDRNLLIIHDPHLFDSIINDVEYVSPTKYAALHGKSRSIVKKLCLDERFEGMRKVGNRYLIPVNAPYPDRKPRTAKTDSETGD